MTDPERQAAQALCKRIDARLHKCDELIVHWRRRRHRPLDSLTSRDTLDLDESRLVIRRLLAETKDE